MIFRQWRYEIEGLKRALDSGTVPSAESLQQLAEILDQGMSSLEKERERLRAQEHEMALALSHATDAVAVYCPDQGIRLANPAFEDLVGIAGADLIGRNFESFLDRDGTAAWRQIQNLLAAGQTYEGMLQHLKGPEGPRSLVISAVLAQNPLGGMIHQVLTLRDVTEELAVEEKLRGQKLFLEKLVNLSDNAVGVFNQEGRWLMENLALKTLFSDLGKEGPKLLSTLLSDQFGRKHRLDQKKLTLTTSRGEKTFLTQGQKVPASYLLGQTDEKPVYVVYLSDLSELVAKKEELDTKTRALSIHRLEKKWARRELANSLSIQLSQPLNVCKAILGRLQMAQPQDQKPGMVELNRRLFEMESVLRDALRAEDFKGYAEGQATSLDLEKGLAHLFAPRLQEAGLDFILENGHPKTPYPMTSEVLLLLVGFLIDNATEALEGRKGQVLVRLFEDPLGRHITVEDSGDGIPEEHRMKVFEPLHTTKEGHEGLSLTMLFQILNQQGARIEINRSALGGALMMMTFP
ncbi:MAG: PAS domain-containing protein [bacterium]|nr:PAS domain-containing protein [bacterium]